MSFFENLPDSDANEAMNTSKKIMSLSHLYKHVEAFDDDIDDAMHFFKNGVDAIYEAAYITNLHFLSNGAYTDYVKLTNVCRSPGEAYANYEDVFDAALTKLNSNKKFVSISDTLATWSLIYNDNVDPSQHLRAISTAKTSSAYSIFCEALVMTRFSARSHARLGQQCLNIATIPI